jgi:inhibitor of cysteine peptidase
MTSKAGVVLGAALVLACCTPAAAALCEKCRGLMYIESAGTCSACGGKTASGALKLCEHCSATLHRCEHCLAPLDDNAKPLPASATATGTATTGAAAAPSSGTSPAVEKLPLQPVSAEPPPAGTVAPGKGPPAIAPPAIAPPATAPRNQPIDPSKPGTYVAGKWQYKLEINDPGTRNEGRAGWLLYDGHKLPRGQVNDYYSTPWGPIYWVDAPAVKWGLHGWMPIPAGQVARVGRPLPLPAVAVGPAGAPAAAASPWLEIGKTDNGKRARVRVGRYVLIRLPGNPTTGYRWQAAAVNGQSIRLLAEPQYVAATNKSAVVGGGGTFFFKFQAVQPGLTTVRLVYVRSWEKNQPPVEVFTCTIEVPPPHA